MSPVDAFVGVGSNLGDPAARVREAIAALADVEQTRVLRRSALYRNPAVGPGRQPDYVNAVAALATTLAPHALLDALQSIERRMGRERGPVRWAPRVIDLDLLIYGDRLIDDERLTVPHPRIAERPFVLYPLAEVAPDLEIPGGGPLAAMLRKVSDAGLSRAC
ncbi:MAG: 2-amino-4-hydroxy-6-hydroxymethyldihydropteridine diphosphokinase [Gammaproteobacteria bacterium]|nr:2-amino-4-hydroxy-6-hydroxymethyldihydropteridine diphosphokinase [Gammaproteobacteria bacterium]